MVSTFIEQGIGQGTRSGGEAAEGKAGKSNGPVNLFSLENVPPFYSKAARVAFEKLEKGSGGDRSLPVFEEYRRFEEVAEILKAKYGDRVKDLVPTVRSELNLYRDDVSYEKLPTKTNLAIVSVTLAFAVSSFAAPAPSAKAAQAGRVPTFH